jgi:transcriptional regulatory protein LevR
MKHWMFRCDEVSQKVSRSLDVSLPFHHRMAIRMHLLMCRYCARFRRQLILLRAVSRNVDDDPSTAARLSNEVKARIKRALRAAA